MKKIFILVGTRPNFIKVTQFKKIGGKHNLDIKIIHTGQHYDENMANIFFDQFELKPDFFLNISQGNPLSQIAEIIQKLQDLFTKEGNPDLFIVPGDVNSTMAGAIVANKMGVKLAHLESGLRSNDRKMPEEHNRIVTDNLADICFVTEPSGLENLKSEKVNADVRYVGNTMIDTLVGFSNKIDASNVLDEYELSDKNYYLMTFHRPSNVDNKSELIELIDTIKSISDKRTTVLPLHPRTRNNLLKNNLLQNLLDLENVIVTNPLGYFEFQKLIKHAKTVITDSGGIQEETTFRQVPCLTMRENTERPVTITLGTNTLVPFEKEVIIQELEKIESNTYKKGEIPKLWDGKATERIIESIVNKL